MQDRKLKFIMIGNTMVGKTALLLRLVEGKFHSTTTTIGIEFRKRMELIDQNDWVVELWDTTGQYRFRKVVSQFFRGIHGAIIVFDLTNEKTLDVVPGWVADINNCVPESTPKMLFGNKADLLEGYISPEYKEKISRIAQENNLTYFQGSVKTGENVEYVYCKLLRESYSRMPAELKIVTRPTVRIDPNIKPPAPDNPYPKMPVRLDSSMIRKPQPKPGCC